MSTIVKIHMDDDSIECLKSIKGKRLLKIGYVMDFSSPLATVLIFEDFTVRVDIDVILIDEDLVGDEYPRLVFKYAEVVDDVAYKTSDGVEKYEYRDFDMIIDAVDVVSDYVQWENSWEREGEKLDDTFINDMRNIVVMRSGDRCIVFYVWSSVYIEMYEDESVLDRELSIQKLWEPEGDDDEDIRNVVYRRTSERL